MNYEFTTQPVNGRDIFKRLCLVDGAVSISATVNDYEDAVTILQVHQHGAVSLKLPAGLARTLAAELIAAADAWDAHAAAQEVAA